MIKLHSTIQLTKNKNVQAEKRRNAAIITQVYA